MHVLIITDLEGISCVDSIDMIPRTNEGYKKACEYLMLDTNAAIDGAFAGGATSVTVIDGHGGGGNFIPEMLDKRALPYNADKAPSFDALLCVGAHAMAGTENAFLDHTQSSATIFEYCINGVPYGEMGQQAFWLGHFGVPLVMASGDVAACREVEALVPGVVTACVKEAVGRNKAICIPQEEALKQIRQAAVDGVRRCKEITPCRLSLPAEVTLTFSRNDYCDAVMHQGLERNGRTIKKTIHKIETFSDLVDF